MRTHSNASSSAAGSASGANQRSSATSSSGDGSPESSRHSKKALIVASPVGPVGVGHGRDEAPDLDLDAGLLAQLAPHALLQ